MSEAPQNQLTPARAQGWGGQTWLVERLAGPEFLAGAVESRSDICICSQMSNQCWSTVATRAAACLPHDVVANDHRRAAQRVGAPALRQHPGKHVARLVRPQASLTVGAVVSPLHPNVVPLFEFHSLRQVGSKQTATRQSVGRRSRSIGQEIAVNLTTHQMVLAPQRCDKEAFVAAIGPQGHVHDVLVKPQ